MYLEAILFIAPHEQIAKTAKQVMQQMKIDIPVIIARNDEAVAKAGHSDASVLLIAVFRLKNSVVLNHIKAAAFFYI